MRTGFLIPFDVAAWLSWREVAGIEGVESSRVARGPGLGHAGLEAPIIRTIGANRLTPIKRDLLSDPLMCVIQAVAAAETKQSAWPI